MLLQNQNVQWNLYDKMKIKKGTQIFIHINKITLLYILKRNPSYEKWTIEQNVIESKVEIYF